MLCLNCKTKMLILKEDINYPFADLNLHMLEIPVITCECCGYKEVAIPKIKNIEMNIAGFLINRIPDISGEQIRFLRRYMRMSHNTFHIYLYGKEATENELQDSILAWESGNKKPDQISFILIKNLVENYIIKETQEYEQMIEELNLFEMEDYGSNQSMSL